MVTPRQIAALKYLIFHSQDACHLLRRILFFLLDHSKNLTEEVAVTFSSNQGGYKRAKIKEAVFSLHDMKSQNGTTHLNELMVLMGSNWIFSFARGQYESGTDRFSKEGEGMPFHFTFWLSKEECGQSERGPSQVKRLETPNRADLMAKSIKCPSLYQGHPEAVS